MTDWIENWNEEKIAERFRLKASERFQHAGMPEELLEENLAITVEFCKIAASLIRQELVVELDDGTTFTQTEKSARQLMIWFAKCMVGAMVKCAQKNITGPVKMNLLQQVAFDVYNQGKVLVQPVVSQPATPEREELLRNSQKALQQFTIQQMKTHYEEAKQAVGAE